MTARIASAANDNFGAGVRRCLEGRSKHDKLLWDQAMITEAAAEVKLSAHEADLVEKFKEGTQPLLDRPNGKLPLLHRSAMGSPQKRRGRGKRQVRPSRQGTKGKATQWAYRVGQHRRPFDPHGVDNPSSEDDIHQQEHRNLLEGHPLDNDLRSTHTRCVGESRPQGQEDKGLEDPGLVSH